MSKFAGLVGAALTAMVIGTASMPSAIAAPAMTGSGGIVLDAVPQQAEEARWRGRRVVVVRHYRYRVYRPYRPYFYRPAFYRPVYYGPRCFWRPARTVWTPYGWRWRPAVRVCRW